MPILDLFITHWKEPWEIGEKSFRMFEMQRCLDWSEIKVTLVHDGSEAFPDEYFTKMPFKVHQVCLPHGGIAAARNWCIDHSEAEWIKWCDFDDTFANVFALHDLMETLHNAQNYDLLWFDLLWDDHGTYHLKTDRECIFVHNKCLRRDFLLKNNIRFCEDLTWCEDSAFLAVVEMDIDCNRIGKIHPSSGVMYVYIVRDGSLCNRPEIRFANLQSFFRRHCYVAEEFLKRNLIDQYNTMCVRIMADSFYTLNLAPGITEDKSEHEARVWAWFDSHREQFHACRPEMFDMVMEAVNRECFDGGEITKEAFLDWINKHERSAA